MKYLFVLKSIAFVFVVMLLVLAACENNGSSPSTSPDNSGGNQPSGDGGGSSNQPAPGTADLILSSFTIVGIDAQQGLPYFQIEGTVRNNGNADASGFEASCNYTCPGGPISSSGFSLVQGGYVSANSSFTYRTVGRIACEPVPAMLMNVTCDVDPNNDVPESNENNNSFNPGQLNVPFN